ncbi:DUF4280 domain-containing protein [Paenibacillus glacialis]|uniref:DUF4280 domain-containing protein n=1 Tax=Paenibacillus glacialis TaxID=494026 RepID=A0A168N8J2_9BACL|nr:DUF4280 domain-containing protein [Paenibacillus glacialis]OAB45519.1 hypothetical protein PGLA_04520 [Paenibacillus glacialis]
MQAGPIIVNDGAGGEQKSYVVAGAILSCSFGTQLNRLKIPMCHGVHLKDKAQLSIADYVPGVHIMPFGNCFSRLNPAVQNGQFDTEGLQKAPCVPQILSAWVGGKSDVLVEGEPALLSSCTNSCVFSGSIRIEDDGQELGGTSLGSSGSSNQSMMEY